MIFSFLVSVKPNMAENRPVSKKKMSADWLFRGVLTKVGDTFDRFTGRRWIPSSSLATSELVERMKKLLDAEAKEVQGKGLVVPHNISLKMQWDKFSEDSDKAIAALKTELMTAAVDHINDSLYHTYAPLVFDVKTDYFTEGVKLMVSFDTFDEDVEGVEMNVTIPALNLGNLASAADADTVSANETYIARFSLIGIPKEKSLSYPPMGRISVGRTSENNLALDDISVSKRHASLAVGGDGRLSVADTGSTNGTFINGERIAYGKSIGLNADDKIKFGTVEVTFEHIPRPIVVNAPDAVAEPTMEAVEIGGFEFIRRESPEAPVEVDRPSEVLTEHTLNIEPPVTDPDKTVGQVPVPAEVLRPIPPPMRILENTMRVESTEPPLAKTSPSLAPLPEPSTPLPQPSAPLPQPSEPVSQPATPVNSGPVVRPENESGGKQ